MTFAWKPLAMRAAAATMATMPPSKMRLPALPSKKMPVSVFMTVGEAKLPKEEPSSRRRSP